MKNLIQYITLDDHDGFEIFISQMSTKNQQSKVLNWTRLILLLIGCNKLTTLVQRVEY